MTAILVEDRRYSVNGTRKLFTFEHARRIADDIFSRTGIIVSIEEWNAPSRKNKSAALTTR